MTHFGLITNIEENQKIYNHVLKKISQEFRLNNIGETKHFLIEGVNQNELMSKKHKKVYRVLNYIEHLLFKIYTDTGCVSISAFASLVRIPIGIISSALELRI